MPVFLPFINPLHQSKYSDTSVQTQLYIFVIFVWKANLICPTYPKVPTSGSNLPNSSLIILQLEFSCLSITYMSCSELLPTDMDH